MHNLDTIAKAAELLRQGGVVAIPTETVYGLAANAYLSDAVTRVFEIKNRPFFDPLICHFGSVKAILDVIPKISADQIKLLEAFAPGPLTVLVPKPAVIPDLVSSGSSLVAVRVPAHALTLKLLQSLDFPLAAPSANPFGYISPTRASHVKTQLGGKVDYILDGGPSVVGVESTVVELAGGHGYILRPGGISIEQLASCLPHLQWQISLGHHGQPKSPGQLESHYAPHKALYLVQDQNQIPDCLPEQAHFIGFDRPSSLPYAQQTLLSQKGTTGEAATNLFHALHEAEATALPFIVAQLAPATGLGVAINDRLRRAATKPG